MKRKNPIKVSQGLESMPTSMNNIEKLCPIVTARRVARTGSMRRENRARSTRPPSMGYAGSRLNRARYKFPQTRLRSRWLECT